MDKYKVKAIAHTIHNSDKELKETAEAKSILFDGTTYYYTVYYWKNFTGTYPVIRLRVSKNTVYTVPIYKGGCIYITSIIGKRYDSLQQAKLNKELPAPIKGGNKEV